MYSFVTKRIFVLVAIVMLLVFLAPVSASTPNGLSTTAVILVEPANGKSEKKDNVAHLDRNCTIGDKGPPEFSCAEYSQENKYYTISEAALITTELNISEQKTLQNTGPPICGVLLVGATC